MVKFTGGYKITTKVIFQKYIISIHFLYRIDIKKNVSIYKKSL